MPEGCDPGGDRVEVVCESGRAMEVEVPPQMEPGTVLEVRTNGDEWGAYGHKGDPLVEDKRL